MFLPGKLKLVILIILIKFPSIYAKDSTNVFSLSNIVHSLRIDGGFKTLSGNLRESIPIRQNLSSYYLSQSSQGSLSLSISGYSAGIYWCITNPKIHTTVSIGLQYLSYFSECTGYSASNSKFFYLRYLTTDTVTKFARVESIEEINNYLNIPIEIKCNFFQYDWYGLYLMVGYDFSITSFNNKTNLNFHNNDMEIYEKEIAKNIGINPEKFYNSFYGAIGINLGKPHKTLYSLELNFGKIISENNFRLTDVERNTGIKFSVQFPIIK